MSGWSCSAARCWLSSVARIPSRSICTNAGIPAAILRINGPCAAGDDLHHHGGELIGPVGAQPVAAHQRCDARRPVGRARPVASSHRSASSQTGANCHTACARSHIGVDTKIPSQSMNAVARPSVPEHGVARRYVPVAHDLARRDGSGGLLRSRSRERTPRRSRDRTATAPPPTPARRGPAASTRCRPAPTPRSS